MAKLKYHSLLQDFAEVIIKRPGYCLGNLLGAVFLELCFNILQELIGILNAEAGIRHAQKRDIVLLEVVERVQRFVIIAFPFILLYLQKYFHRNNRKIPARSVMRGHYRLRSFCHNCINDGHFSKSKLMNFADFKFLL